MRYALPAACLALIAGILLGESTEIASHRLSMLVLLLLAAYGIGAWFSLRWRARLPWIAIPLIGLLGFELTHQQRYPPETDLVRQWGRIVEIEGRVIGYGRVRLSPDGIDCRLPLELTDAVRWTGQTRYLHKGSDCTDIGYGDVLRARVKVRAPSDPGTPGAFHPRRYLYSQGIGSTVSLWRGEKLHIVRRGATWHPLRLVERLRDAAGTMIRHGGYTEEDALVAALLLGEREYLNRDLRKLFAWTGTAHLLAISGLHLTIVALIAWAMARRLAARWTWLALRFNARRVAAALTLPPTIFYALMSGFQLPVQRALIMIVVYLAAPLLGREVRPLHSLALAAIIVLLMSPYSLYTASFQLTFAAVLGLILFYRPVERGLRALIERISPESGMRRRERLALWFAGIACVGLLMPLMLAPILLTYFPFITLQGALANLLLIPLVNFIAIPLGLLAIPLLAAGGELGHWTLLPLEFVAWLILQIVDFLAGLPGPRFFLPRPTPAILAAWYLLLVGLRLLPDRRWWGKRVAALGVMLLAATIGWQWYATRPLQNRFRLTMLEVGQSESMLLELPDGKRVMLDAGGTPWSDLSLAEFVLIPYFRYRWIDRLDEGWVSHGNIDHYEGFVDLQDYAPPELYVPPHAARAEAEPTMQALAGMYAAKGALNRLCAGMSRDFGDARFEVLHPPCAPDARLRNPNDRSLVIRMDYRGWSILFTGDIEQPAIDYLRENAPLQLLDVDVLKVPHHGSNTSDDPRFYKLTSPGAAVLSCGDQNMYRYPHATVVKGLEDVGAMIFRTDLDGAMTIEIDEEGLRIRTHRNRRGYLARRGSIAP